MVSDHLHSVHERGKSLKFVQAWTKEIKHCFDIWLSVACILFDKYIIDHVNIKHVVS